MEIEIDNWTKKYLDSIEPINRKHELHIEFVRKFAEITVIGLEIGLVVGIFRREHKEQTYENIQT